jgi:hypothetical protein
LAAKTKLALPLSHHPQVARPAPGSHPAVFAAHAQRREGVDPAGRDRACPTSRTWCASTTNDQLSPEFLSLNPNNKIPAILDPDGPGGQPLALFESGAILLYLAEKAGRFLPPTRRSATQAVQWLMFQMGGIGPMFGQLGFFHKFAGKDFEDKRPRDRYVAESRRLLGVLERQVPAAAWLLGDDYTHRRHRHLPLGQQPGRLLRRRAPDAGQLPCMVAGGGHCARGGNYPGVRNRPGAYPSPRR